MRNNQQQIARRVIYHEKAFEIQNVSVNINLCNCIEIKQLIGTRISALHNTMLITIFFDILHIFKEL